MSRHISSNIPNKEFSSQPLTGQIAVENNDSFDKLITNANWAKYFIEAGEKKSGFTC